MSLEFAGFRLVDKRYRKIEPNKNGWLWSETLDLYLGVENGKLRYFTADGVKVASPEEDALANKKLAELQAARVEQEAQRAEQEAQRAERLAAKLREIGIEPDSL